MLNTLSKCLCIRYDVSNQHTQHSIASIYDEWSLINIARLSSRTLIQNSTRPAKPRLRINSEDLVSGDDVGHSTSAQTNTNEPNALHSTADKGLLEQVTLRSDAGEISTE